MADVGLTDVHWQALYRRLERPLFNLAYRYVWQRDEAMDVLHDAFLQLWSRRARVHPDTADRYLWICVLNAARNRRRWRKLRSFIASDEVAEILPDPSPGSEVALLCRERDAALHVAIEGLPEKLREVLLLSEFSDMSHRDIAALLRVPPGTVASRRHLAIQRLRDHLREKA